MATNEKLGSQPYFIWQNKGIGRPPIRQELVLSFREIRKATLSFTIDFGKGGTKLDPEQAIVINDKVVPNLDLPRNNKSPSLEYVERDNIDITSLLKSSERGERNVFEVNYLLSKRDILESSVPAMTIGKLTMKVTVYFPSIITIQEKAEGTVFCMVCGNGGVPQRYRVCPFCEQPRLIAGTDIIECRVCHMKLPATAKFCEGCGAKTPEQALTTKLCVNPQCKRSLAADAKFCDSCGTQQPSESQGYTAPEEKILHERCGTYNLPNAKFCSGCGMALQS